MVKSAAPARDEAGSTANLPPVAMLAVATLGIIIIGGIIVAIYIPDRPPLWIPASMLAGAAALLAVNVVLLSRVKPFAWNSFFLVAKWSLVAYAVIAGMLEYVFIRNHTPQSVLLLLTGMLIVFAIDIPLLFAFSVARYQPVSDAE